MKFKLKLEHITAYLFPACMFMHGTFTVVNRYIENPVAMTFYDVSAKSEEMPFVQVCNQYWVDKRKLASWNASWQLFEYMKRGFTGFNNYKGKRSSHLVDKLEEEFQQLKQNNPSFDYRKFFASVALERKRFLTSCRWEEHKYSCDKLFEPVFTPSGYCMFLTPSRAPKQIVPGPVGGLRFLVRIYNRSEPDLLYNSGFDNGVHLSISGHWNPFLTDPIFVSNAKRAFIEVQNTKRKFIKDCTERTKLDLFEMYTQSGCHYECYVNKTFEMCNCSLFAYNVSIHPEQFCSPLQYRNCIFSNHHRLIESLDTKCRDICPKRCESVDTQTKVSYSTTDSRKIEIYNRRRNKSWNGNTIMIHIYHSKIGHTMVEEHRTTTITGSLSNIGGLMCLWLGLNARILMLTNWLRGKLFPSKKAADEGGDEDDVGGGADQQPLKMDGGTFLGREQL